MSGEQHHEGGDICEYDGCHACVWIRLKKRGEITSATEPQMKQAFRDAYNSGLMQGSPMPEWLVAELRTKN